MFNNHPQLQKVRIEDETTLIIIYGGGVSIRDKRIRERRKSLRIVLKQPSEHFTAGTLFRFGKLTLQAQEGTFEKLIVTEPVQVWFMEAAKAYLNTI